MARLWMSGDEYLDTLGGGAANGLWDSVVGTVTVGAAFARSGQYGARVNPVVAGTHFREKTFNTGAGTDPKWGQAIQPKVRPNTLTEIVVFLGSTQFSIRAATDGSFELWNDLGAIKIGSSSAVQALDTWFWLNVSYVESTAVATAKINGTTFASGAITAGDIGIVDVGIGIATAATGEFWFDDHILNDQTGTDETGEPEDQKIIMLKPNAAGSSADGARGGADSGSDFGQLNEDPPDDATAYYILDDIVVPDRIEVNCEAASLYMGANDTVKAVQPFVRHRSESATLMSYAATIKSGASRQQGTTKTHNDVTWKTNGDLIPRLPSLTSYTDPATGVAWTTAGLDSAEVGAVAIDATPDIWITSLALIVSYVPAAAGRVRVNPHGMLDTVPLSVLGGRGLVRG